MPVKQMRIPMLYTKTLRLIPVLGLALTACGEARINQGGTPPTVLLTASPPSVTSGGSSVLTWSSRNATSCSASGAWSGTKASSGSESTGALSASSNYSLTCIASGVRASASVTVVVSGTPPPTGPAVSLAGIPSDVTSGAPSLLVWSSANVTSCSASGAWSGAKATSGTQSTGALTSNSTYFLDCTGSSGAASASLTVTVSPPPTPPPPPLTSTALGTLAASMAPGTWAQLSVSNQNTILGVGSVSGSMIGYSNSMPWNPFSKVIEIIGMDHNYSNGLRHVRYDELTNQFILVQEGIDGTGIAHGYDHNTINPFTGDVYHRVYSGFTGTISSKKKAPGAASFVGLPGVAGSEQVAIGACWWSGPFIGGGSQGSFMVFNSGNATGGANDGQIVAYNPMTNTWFYNQEGKAPNYGSSFAYSSLIEYSAIKNVAVYGGGNAAPNRLWRISSDGSVLAMPNLPPGKGVGMLNGLLVDEPVTGNFLLLSAGELWELNPSGSGTWTQQTGTRAPPSGVGVPGPSPNVWVIAASIPEYGVVAFITQPSQTGATFYLYKHQ